ncbi:hypothetical protein [Spirosoma panaciterrae]|uniref:hypothetical protein n=1 Tax=Spirosoma panaciterrae TaxID=496058 RepID=UPI001B7FB39F|nr:hypothetical protein [Spirosoma panaciterrae]
MKTDTGCLCSFYWPGGWIQIHNPTNLVPLDGNYQVSAKQTSYDSLEKQPVRINCQKTSKAALTTYMTFDNF